MRPALSLIVFTTLSGVGFGLAVVLGVSEALFSTNETDFLMFFGVPIMWLPIKYVVALGFIGVGIMASTFHLGHPERAWRALSQWRSSWLSREGVLAGITSVLILAHLALSWYELEASKALSLLVAVSGFITIISTAMIYASLKTVARWHHPMTVAVFIAYGLSGGLLLSVALDSVIGKESAGAVYALILVVIGFLVDLGYVRFAGKVKSSSSAASATGLGSDVRMLMPPHSEENWLQHEMGFEVARKHSGVLRILSYIFVVGIPLVLIVFGFLFFAFVAHVLGVMVSRWLFFAEAKHTVMLYY